MPGKKTVPKLLKLNENYASKIVLKLLRQHTISPCKYCTKYTPLEKCHDLVTLREELSGLPTCIRDSIYQNVTSDADFSNNSCQCFYLHTYLFEDKDLRIIYESNGEHNDEHFFSRYGKNVKQFTCKLTDVNTASLEKNFTAATDLQSVEFDNLTEAVLEVIGKCCVQLKSIKGKLISPSETFNSAVRKLVFEDPETQLQKNKCCDTLECFDVKVDYNSLQVFSEQIKILLHNVPNLKTFGYQIRLEYAISLIKPDNQNPLKLKSAKSVYLTLETIEIVKTYFPELKKIVTNIGQPLNVLQALNTISSIRKLAVVSEIDTSNLYNGLLLSEWSNLRTLMLIGQISEVLDLSLFAMRLPNLEILGIINCCGVTWNGKKYFEKLEIVHLEGYTADNDFSGMASFSKTVVFMTIHSVNNNTPVIPELLNEVFPQLKDLEVSPSTAYNIETIKAIFEKCPRLNSVTCLSGGKTGEEYSRIAEYLKENNIDCTVE